jgi:hypothetical protein
MKINPRVSKPAISVLSVFSVVQDLSPSGPYA